MCNGVENVMPLYVDDFISDSSGYAARKRMEYISSSFSTCTKWMNTGL